MDAPHVFKFVTFLIVIFVICGLTTVVGIFIINAYNKIKDKISNYEDDLSSLVSTYETRFKTLEDKVETLVQSTKSKL